MRPGVSTLPLPFSIRLHCRTCPCAPLLNPPLLSPMAGAMFDEGYHVIGDLGPRRTGWSSRRAGAALLSVLALAAVLSIPYSAPCFWTPWDAPGARQDQLGGSPPDMALRGQTTREGVQASWRKSHALPPHAGGCAASVFAEGVDSCSGVHGASRAVVLAVAGGRYERACGGRAPGVVGPDHGGLLRAPPRSEGRQADVRAAHVTTCPPYPGNCVRIPTRCASPPTLETT